MKFIKKLISDIEAMPPEKREAKQSAVKIVTDWVCAALMFMTLIICGVGCIGLFLEVSK